MVKIFLLSLLFFSYPALAEHPLSNTPMHKTQMSEAQTQTPDLFQKMFIPDWFENEAITLEGSQYLFISHPSRLYDSSATALSGIKKYIHWAHQYAIPTLMSFASDATQNYSQANRYYVDGKEVEFELQSEGGAHLLSFPKAHSLYFAGGNLSLCLCESIRDSVENSASPHTTLKIFLLGDAIYENASNVLEDLPLPQATSEKSYSLNELIHNVGQKKFFHFLAKALFGAEQTFGGENGLIFCPRQNSGGKNPLRTKFFDIKVYFQNKIKIHLRADPTLDPRSVGHLEFWLTSFTPWHT